MTERQQRGTPIPKPARGLVIVPSHEVQQYAFARAAVPSVETKQEASAHPGYTIEELRVRLHAAHAPIWHRLPDKKDFNWMAGHMPTAAVPGYMHAFDHEQARGTLTACVTTAGHHGACTETAVSAGDGIRRWRHDFGVEIEPLEWSRIETGARAWLHRAREHLLNAGHSQDDVAASDVFADAIASGLLERRTR